MSITLSTTVGDVVLGENYDAYSVGIDFDGPYIVKQYIAPNQASVFPVINALRGTVTGSGGSSGAVVRSTPHVCPESSNLYCLSAVCDPDGPVDARDGGRPGFRLWPITCRYGVPKYDVAVGDDPGGENSFPNDSTPGSPFTYAVMSVDFASETIPIPGAAYKFLSPTLSTNVNVVRTIGTANMVFVRKFVPYLPFVGVSRFLNKLNSTTFLGQSRGQIKLSNVKMRREYMSDGKRVNEVELHFLWREYQHNNFVRDDTGLFDTLYAPDGTTTLYEYIEMKPLLSEIVK